MNNFILVNEYNASNDPCFDLIKANKFALSPGTSNSYWNNMKFDNFAQKAFISLCEYLISIASTQPKSSSGGSKDNSKASKDNDNLSRTNNINSILYGLVHIAVAYNFVFDSDKWRPIVDKLLEIGMPLVSPVIMKINDLFNKTAVLSNFKAQFDDIVEISTNEILHNSLPIFNIMNLMRFIHNTQRNKKFSIQILKGLKQRMETSNTTEQSLVLLHLIRVLMTIFPGQFSKIMAENLKEPLSTFLAKPSPISDVASVLGQELIRENNYFGAAYFTCLSSIVNENTCFDVAVPFYFDQTTPLVANFLYSMNDRFDGITACLINFVDFFIKNILKLEKTTTIEKSIKIIQKLKFSTKGVERIRKLLKPSKSSVSSNDLLSPIISKPMPNSTFSLMNDLMDSPTGCPKDEIVPNTSVNLADNPSGQILIQKDTSTEDHNKNQTDSIGNIETENLNSGISETTVINDRSNNKSDVITNGIINNPEKKVIRPMESDQAPRLEMSTEEISSSSNQTFTENDEDSSTSNINSNNSFVHKESPQADHLQVHDRIPLFLPQPRALCDDIYTMNSSFQSSGSDRAMRHQKRMSDTASLKPPSLKLPSNLVPPSSLSKELPSFVYTNDLPPPPDFTPPPPPTPPADECICIQNHARSFNSNNTSPSNANIIIEEGIINKDKSTNNNKNRNNNVVNNNNKNSNNNANTNGFNTNGARNARGSSNNNNEDNKFDLRGFIGVGRPKKKEVVMEYSGQDSDIIDSSNLKPPIFQFIPNRVNLSFSHLASLTTPILSGTKRVFTTPLYQTINNQLFNPVREKVKQIQSENVIFQPVLLAGGDLLITNMLQSLVVALSETPDLYSQAVYTWYVVPVDSSAPNEVANFLGRIDPVYHRFVESVFTTMAGMAPVADVDDDARVVVDVAAIVGQEMSQSEALTDNFSFSNNTWFSDPSPNKIFQFSLHHFLTFGGRSAQLISVWKCEMVLESGPEVVVPWISSAHVGEEFSRQVTCSPPPNLRCSGVIRGVEFQQDKEFAEKKTKIRAISLWNIEKERRLRPTDPFIVAEWTKEPIVLKAGEAKIAQAAKIASKIVTNLSFTVKDHKSFLIMIDQRIYGPIKRFSISPMEDPRDTKHQLQMRFATFYPPML